MSRRRSITLHDIVRMNPVAKEHYNQIRDHSKGNRGQILDSVGEDQPSTATFVHPEEADVTIEYDPLLLAESLILLEEDDENEESKEERKEDFKDDEPLLPEAVPMSARKAQISGTPKIISIKEVSKRKKSAIDEHERVVDALLKMGIQILDL